jgi:exonuclease III
MAPTNLNEIRVRNKKTGDEYSLTEWLERIDCEVITLQETDWSKYRKPQDPSEFPEDYNYLTGETL